MLKKIESSKDLFITTFSFTFLFYILAHGYRFVNSMFSGDSLLMIHQNDSAWEIALGRFVQPILVMLRGGMESPYLICMISVIFLSLSAFLVVDFLEINRVLSVVLVSAVMTCNATVLATNATFLSYADFYIIALFLSVFGVWLIKKEKLIYLILGAVSLSISIGTYQAYISLSIGLVMIHFIFKMTENPGFKSIFRSVMKYFVTFLATAIIYYVVWKIFQNIFGIWTADTYNGMASVGEYSLASIGEVIATAYANVFSYFLNPDTFITMPFRGVSLSIVWVYILRFCNILVLLLLLLTLVIKNLKCKTNWWQRALQVLIVVLFPLGINFVCLVSGGMEHTLMIYAFCLVYVLAVKSAEDCLAEITTIKLGSICKASIPWFTVLASLAVLSWSNVVYSNQVYFKKDLQDKAIFSMLTRIVYEVESMEGYVPGETPVAFYGSFENNDNITDIEVFKDIKPYGMGKSPLTYEGTDYAYLKYILNVNMNFTRVGDQNPMIQQMPIYPAEGSVAYVDGTIVVKIADVK